MAAENYYEILGLKKGARDDEVKQAFRDLARTLHPDRNPNNPDAERRFRLVSNAYDALKDEARRRAYDEWLAFARKHERSRLAQWGRLAAMLVLLLLGPSIALYWAFVLLKGWDTPIDRPVRVATATQPAKPKERVPAESRPTSPKPAAERATESQNAPAAPVGDASRQAQVPALVTPSKPAQQEPPPAPKSEVTAALPPPEEPAPARTQAPPPRSQPVPRSQSAPFVTPEEALAAKAVPQETPTPVKPPEPARSPAAPQTATRNPPPGDSNADERGRRLSLRELAGAEDNASTPPLSSPPDVANRRVQRDETAPATPPRSSAAEGSARNMARMLAETKESDETPRGEPPADADQRQAATEPGARPRRTPLQRPLNEGEFSDCGGCPVMSVVTADPLAPSAQGARPPSRNLAISKFEVSVAEWNACVREGVCRGYRNPEAGNTDRPVADVTRSDAVQYVDWLTRKTGRSYRLMRVAGGGGERRGDRDQECSSTDWAEREDCIRRLRQSGRIRDGYRSETQPYEATSGFRVTRSLGPDG